MYKYREINFRDVRVNLNMLYPTHKRMGILWGLLAFPLGVFLGLVPVISVKMTGTELFMVIMCSYLGMQGALFGARFPDIDSHTSRPRKMHPVIGKIFDAFGVKHRGKYSHDFFSIGLTFGIIYFLIAIIGDRFVQSVAGGSTFLGVVAYLSFVIFIWVMAMSSVDVLLWFANLTKNRRMWAKVNAKRMFYGVIIGIPLFLILWVSGVYSPLDIIGGIDKTRAIMNAMLLITSFKVYIIFTLVGAYSHLFADMLTKTGVSIFFIRISPMGTVNKVRKIPVIGPIIVPLDPKTGGAWEDLVSKIVTVVCIPATVVATISLLGYWV